MTTESGTTATQDTTTTSSAPGSLVRQMLSNARQNNNNHDEISINGQVYAPTGHSAQMAIIYSIANFGLGYGALVDGGKNGGLASNDVKILETDPLSKVDVPGIGNKVFTAMSIIHCAGLIEMVDEGKLILIMSQYAHCPSGKIIHSKNQLESFGCHVFDSSWKDGGRQSIITPGGYVIPLHVHNEVFYMDMSMLKDSNLLLQHYPHCFITSNATQDPSLVDEEYILTEFRQPLQVQIHLEMPGILVQLGHIQRT